MLQTARRLLADSGELLKTGWQAARSRGKATVFSMDGALRRAADLAHPHNRDGTLWAAQGVLDGIISRTVAFRERSDFNGNVLLINFNNHPDTTLKDALLVFDDAIKAQGSVNIAASKAKGRK